MQAAIVAGGLARRLGERAAHVPKSLVRVLDRPFLAWQLEKLRGSGFDRVVLCVGHLGELIRKYAGDGSAFGVALQYSEDGPKPLGTGGALRKALPLLDDTFLVTYGDSYLPFDYRAPLDDLRANPSAEGTLAVFPNQGRWDASNAQIRGDVVARYEKGAHDPTLDQIDYGAMALRRSALTALPPDCPVGLDELQQRLAERGLLRAFIARERFYEIGSERGIRDFEGYLRAGARTEPTE